MNKSRILIVEDEAIVARDLSGQLTELGYEPAGQAANGEDALALAEQLHPDLVLMDIHLKGSVDGIAAAQTIRERFAIPVVFISAYLEESILDRAKAAKPFGYVSKPFQSNELRMVIDLALTKHQAEIRLRQAYEEQAAILSTAMDGFWSVDMQGRILDVNDAACRMTGYAREEILRLSITDLEADKSPADIAANIERIKQSGGARFERRHRCKDGHLIDVELSANYLPDSGGRMVCFLRDATERKREEEVLTFLAQTSSKTANEPFFNALARHLAKSLAMDFVCIDRLEGDGLTARTVAVWCDGKFEDNVTYALKDTPCGHVVGKTVCCFPASVCQFFPRDQVLQDLRAESYVGVTLWSHTGQPIGLIAIIGRSPLANRRLAEATLELVAIRAAGELERLDAEGRMRQSEERLKKAQTMAHIGNWEWNIQTGSLHWEDENYRIFGLSPETIPSVETFLETVHPEDLARVKQSIQNALDGKPFDLDMRIRRSDGTERVVHACAEVERDTVGKPVRFFGTVQDITERLRTQEQIRLLAKLSDISPATITVHDIQGNFLYANQRTFDLHGYTKEEFLGINLHELDVPASAELIRARTQKILETGETSFQVEHYRKDRTTLPLEVFVKAMKWGGERRFAQRRD